MKHEKALRKLKTARGQIDAAIKMIEEERYCIDISKQLLATISLLKNAHSEILKKHIETCVKDATSSNDAEEINVKLEELEEVFDYLKKT
ncbi:MULTISPECIES: metal-sensing transcriptional repressor [Petrotoga]|uniref:Copper-sensing transcriptional repressor CsoR n=2 Tax=Petrotoga sibirica TaxID=156202 RepID=A0A4R8ETK3_9BACT|nr:MULTISPECIES: metal-sensing transcriptional repressor [Petrotoga]POZ89312.1 CsoR family transcriptional regulator [Petrotoga sibirica DSM 13575]POZ91085.1 CsoR family transcriptional regulator [Petrotoga sp. SL27]TDX15636.1 DNA-binding FrmR family transcriptional regulator [Petrotoga sibirica]